MRKRKGEEGRQTEKRKEEENEKRDDEVIRRRGVEESKIGSECVGCRTMLSIED